MSSQNIVRNLHPGMGQAVAERTVLRPRLPKGFIMKLPIVDGARTLRLNPSDKYFFDWMRAAYYSKVKILEDQTAESMGKPDIVFENWEDVAARVAEGNVSIVPEDKSGSSNELERMRGHVAKATLLMSGRHLQHGDEEQPSRNMEVFTNCSTAPTSFALFLLLLNGAGVGRDYSDEMILVDFDHAPQLRCVLSDSHSDFIWGRHESVRDARHKYGKGRKVKWHKVEDSREGWAKAVEIFETMAFQKIHSDKTLILDFSDVRPRGAPIRGMQMRPSSGPVPLMDALMNVSTLKGLGLDPWNQAMYADHYLAECVLVGGARRAARMSTKSWRDRNVLDFIEVKRPVEYDGKTPDEVEAFREEWKGRFKRGETMMPNPPAFLWSSNNSITVDEEFWELVRASEPPAGKKGLWKHAKKVFDRLVDCSYGDGTGEPGIINVDKLTRNDDGWDYETVSFVGSKKYQVESDTRIYLSLLAKQAKAMINPMITNPCFSGDTMVAVADGRNAVSIKELAEEGKRFPVYSARRRKRARKGAQWVSEVKWASAFKTGTRALVEVVLSDGTSFRCTEEHRLATVDGVYVEARHSLDQELEGFFTKKHKSYRMVNSVSSGFAYQHRMIWEFFNGPKPEGYEIDHTIPCENDSLANLQLLERSVHLEKTSQERLGDANPIHRCDRERWTNNLSCSSFFSSNPRFSGVTDEEIISVALQLIDEGVPITINNLRAVNPRIPSSFSKNRFGGSIRNLIDIVTGAVSYNTPIPPERMEAVVDAEPPSNPKVVEVRYTEDVESVYDLNVEDNHNFYILTDGDERHMNSSGVLVHNCGEIALTVTGGYCTIADVVPFHADSLAEAEDAFRVATRALIRVNTMDSLYQKEVERTNRIGVGMTGVHEFAWKFFKVGFKTLINPDFTMYFGEKERGHSVSNHEDPRVRAAAFWMALSRFSRAVKDEARKYSEMLGVVVPHTDTTIKPAGCGTLDTVIRTSEGDRTFEEIFTQNGVDIHKMTSGEWFDLKEPMMVRDLANEQRLVTKLYCNGEAEVFEVTMDDGSSFKFTGNHRFLTTEGWKRVDEMRGDEDIISFK